MKKKVYILIKDFTSKHNIYCFTEVIAAYKNKKKDYRECGLLQNEYNITNTEYRQFHFHVLEFVMNEETI
jgi:hypothetical protein